MPPRVNKQSPKKKAAPTKAAAAKKSPAKKATALKKGPAKKLAAKKAPNKTAPKKATPKKTTQKKSAPQKATPQKTITKKATAPKKATTKKATAIKAPSSPTKSKPTGLGGFAPGKLQRNNTIDQGLAGLNAALASQGEVHDSITASLVFIEPAKNSDKYYIVQIIKHKATHEFFVFSRWGRTGTGGQAQLDGPLSESDALKSFEKKFQEKSGLTWDNRSSPAKSGKYKYLMPSAVCGKTGTWQYHLTHDPMGKPDGWYDYDSQNSKEVEDVFLAFQANTSMSIRFIHSETSGYTYEVNLSAMNQTNTTSKKTRPIQRIVK